MVANQKLKRIERLKRIEESALLAQVAKLTSLTDEMMGLQEQAENINASIDQGNTPTETPKVEVVHQKLHWIEHLNGISNLLENQIRDLDNLITQQRVEVQAQHTKVKGWDTLTDQIKKQNLAEQSRVEMAEADDRYLSKD
ncbi:MAG: hypothetical protein AB8B50_13870 [Pirellulaceae bacterium]